MTLENILAKAKTATENHLVYAQFVCDTEVLCVDADAIPDEEQLSIYQTYWFELEKVNALALDEWESTGKPADWVAAWKERYKEEVEELVARLCMFLRQR